MERWEIREEVYGPAAPWSAVRMLEWELVGDLQIPQRHRTDGIWAHVRTRATAERTAAAWNREHPLGRPALPVIAANGLRHAAGCTPPPSVIGQCDCSTRLVPRRASAPLALPGTRRRVVQTDHPRWCCCGTCMAWWDDSPEAVR